MALLSRREQHRHGRLPWWRRGSLRRLPRARWLPQGTPLPDDIWRGRHRTFLSAAWLACVAASAWAVSAEGLRHALADTLPIALAALTATALSIVSVAGSRLTSRRWGREAASCAAMLALVAVAALAVHLSGGLIETHFLFFIAVGAAAAYQTWAPFLTAVGFVVVHHGLLASTSEHEIFNHPAGQQHPWLWALVHGALLALAAAVGIASWRAEEVVRARLSALGARSRLIVGSIDDGVLALDGGGRVVEANAAAVRLLGPRPLTGRLLRELLEGAGEEGHPRPGAPATPSAPSGVGGLHRVRGRGGSCTPVAVSVAPVHGDERVRAVATVRDLSSVVRADSAERALLELTERARVQRQDVAALQSALRPPALAVPGLQVAVAYEPAAAAPAGGDLYDWLVLPSGQVLLVVVDAMGRGTAATREALAVTTTVRTLAVAGCPLEELVARAGAVLEVTHPQAMATVLIAVLDPRTGRVRLAGGGHPPAVLVAAGAAREVPAEGLGIGYLQPGSGATAEVVLSPGDTLVLYTDGLIEGTRDIDEGLRELTATAAALADLPVDEVPARLLTDVSTCAREDDDCLALVVRRSPAPGPPQPQPGR
ncbi:SpoIIE family protein phosphatase [Kineococcus sp. T13]|uniref:PP2C family protein-serine/threonine phosphatase n=1 Tax=Kineococcus vitellinus TaxID=2696565 RepID=UPI001412C4C7|nr:SpoIIE family protein phosphatase [Kineococcus vitellinus]NAZ74345.1 SpoIIE family protein phosphatase [Kineococcus vitellinus]